MRIMRWLRSWFSHYEVVIVVAETTLMSCRDGMVVTVRFSNTHVIEGIFREWEECGVVHIDQIDRNGRIRPSYWKSEMVERVYRDAAVTRRVNGTRR